jgi:hypothetical protein
MRTISERDEMEWAAREVGQFANPVAHPFIYFRSVIDNIKKLGVE